MKTYDGTYNEINKISDESECKTVKPNFNLTETLVNMTDIHNETIASLEKICIHLFGSADFPNEPLNAECFAKELEFNRNMAEFILRCVVSIKNDIGA